MRKNCASCDPCSDPCGGGGCRPANYDHAKSLKDLNNNIKCLDTILSLNYSGATLNYKAEYHEDIITGKQLGSIITVGDLRDTDVNYDTDALCYELIYSKYGECGDGCQSIENRWHTFSIDSDGALGPQIRYVRGANRYGCPYFLDVPPNQEEYWFQGWRQSGKENGYYQPRYVEELPQDENGNYLVMSIDPVTKEPLYGYLPIGCLINNLMGNESVSVEGVWRAVQGTGGFGGSFDKMNGGFKIEWVDWNDIAETHPAGYGTIWGQMNWKLETDAKTGRMTYTIHNVYFDKMEWKIAEGVTQPTAPAMTLYGVDKSGNKTQLNSQPIVFGKQNVEYTFNKTIEWEQVIDIEPGGTAGPLDFAYIYVDWVNDDEGYMGVKFNSELSDWNGC